ncbi:hypothetical protein LY28_03296 [Ruminiclostridium sufflavum DSM 19573]|uniref:Uncharacterized protein n=1 Tax=Ruminiclostridium sufflavum DSM 19573 TaxID=1121337 RepID=A0A318XIU0_9FIRM|nr:hypothetical protein LY28_03296 [Ruminiclostridium sufflavum DSM 19573]
MSLGNLTFSEAIDELSIMMEHPESLTKTMLESLVERVSVQDLQELMQLLICIVVV